MPYVADEFGSENTEEEGRARAAVLNFISGAIHCNWRPTILLGALILAACSDDELGFDDPAVAACEYTRLRGTVPNEDVYKRVRTTIDGLTVTIVYETAPLNTKPKRDSYSCQFELTANGFMLASSLSDDAIQCGEFIEGLDTMATRRLGPKAMDEAVAKIERCRILLLEELGEKMGQLLDVHIALRDLGIVPIAPEDTILRVE